MIIISYIIPCLILVFVIYFILRPMLFGATYFPTTPKSVETMRRLAEITPGEKIADLGSGDGRILIAFAMAGAEAHGYEVNPLLVWKSRLAIRKAGLENKAIVHWKSFWKADLGQYSTIVAYGFPHIMKKLGDKLKRELTPGSKVISNIFSFPSLSEIKSENKVHLYLISG